MKKIFPGLEIPSAGNTDFMNVYPNPVTNSVIVETGGEHLLGKIVVYSMEGRKVLEEILLGKSPKVEVDLGVLSEGVYFLDCISGISSQKMMVIKE